MNGNTTKGMASRLRQMPINVRTFGWWKSFMIRASCKKLCISISRGLLSGEEESGAINLFKSILKGDDNSAAAENEN